MSRVAQSAPLAQTSYEAADAAAPIPRRDEAAPQDKSPWRKVADFGRSLSLPGLDTTKNLRNAYPETRIAQPPSTPPAAGQAQWR
jgi:hypothetical protein